MREVKKVKEHSQLLLKCVASVFDSKSNESRLNIQPNFPTSQKHPLTIHWFNEELDCFDLTVSLSILIWTSIPQQLVLLLIEYFLTHF